MTSDPLFTNFAASFRKDTQDKQKNINTAKKLKQMTKNQINRLCPDHIIKEYENVLSLMSGKEDYLYNTVIFGEDGNEEYALETEYEYLLETYESLKAGEIHQNLNYFEVLSNFLYIYVKSLETQTKKTQSPEEIAGDILIHAAKGAYECDGRIFLGDVSTEDAMALESYLVEKYGKDNVNDIYEIYSEDIRECRPYYNGCSGLLNTEEIAKSCSDCDTFIKIVKSKAACKNYGTFIAEINTEYDEDDEEQDAYYRRIWSDINQHYLSEYKKGEIYVILDPCDGQYEIQVLQEYVTHLDINGYEATVCLNYKKLYELIKDNQDDKLSRTA